MIQLPPLSAFKSTITLPGFKFFNTPSLTPTGAFYPGIDAVVIIISISNASSSNILY